MSIDPPVLPMPSIVGSLLQLSECVCTMLANEGAGETCWCGLHPGASASWEYCGECGTDTCGMGYVRAGTIFPYDAFPTAVVDERCARPLALAVEVGALRCFPTPQDGNLVPPAVMAEVTIRQALDARALYLALQCCGLDLAVESYQPSGPAGGCVGGLWIAYLPLDVF